MPGPKQSRKHSPEGKAIDGDYSSSIGQSLTMLYGIHSSSSSVVTIALCSRTLFPTVLAANKIVVYCCCDDIDAGGGKRGWQAATSVISALLVSLAFSAKVLQSYLSRTELVLYCDMENKEMIQQREERERETRSPPIAHEPSLDIGVPD